MVLGEQVRRNPNRILHNMDSANTLLETGRYALPYVRVTHNILMLFYIRML